MPGHDATPPSHEDFFAPLDAMPVGVLVLDGGYLVRFWNRTLTHWTRMRPGDILGTDVRERYPDFFDENVTDRLATVFRGGPPAVFSAQLHGRVIPCSLPSGAPRLQHAVVTALRRDGHFLALFSIQDVTDTHQRIQDYVRMRDQALAQRAAELERLTRRLMELDRMKSAFLSSIQHEMRTPLTAIMGFSKVAARKFGKHFQPLVKERPDLDQQAEQLVESLDIITQEGHRLTDRINDVLELTRLHDGSLEWTETPQRPQALIDDAVALTRRDSRAEQVVMEVDVPAGLPDLRVDRTRFVRMIGHVLDNAVQFGASRVAVRASKPEDGGPFEGGLELTVTDDGPGIPEVEQERVFQAFHQVTDGEGLVDKPAGHGLGLAVVKAVAGHYGGAVVAEPAPGGGTVIRLSFPASIKA